MPPLPVIADCFRTVLNWTSDTGLTAHNVMHFLAPGGDALDVLDAIQANADVAMWKHTNIGSTIDSIECTKLDGTSATITRDITDVTNFRGTGSSQIVPQQCAIIKLATALRGRRNRGRLYLPWVQEDAANTGKLSGTTSLDMTAAWVAFANDMAAANVALGVASYVDELWHQAINLVCEAACATQRRRQEQVRQ